ncbi:MAG: dTDP-4-dehydrorhamnose reductase [Halobacteriovoraceae bacterium]|nr:dTDP-4-dehydrorhamnose reductase [Halobacteriovoraceae bacterium]
MILVTGSDGQLGQELKEVLKPQKAIYGTRQDCDITNFDILEKIITQNKIEFIINCAAYTAVDQAESESEMAFLVNEKGPENLSLLAKKHNVKLIHISTDYVFDGNFDQPIREDNPTAPINIYGKSKLAGEQAILKSECAGAIIRTSWLYSRFGNNFVKSMIKHGKNKSEMNIVADQFGTPTSAKDLATSIVEIMPKLTEAKCEVFHFSNEGVASWYDFACAIFEKMNIDCKVHPINTSEYPLAAKRPAYSALNKGLIRSRFNLSIPSWKESLENCLRSL